MKQRINGAKVVNWHKPSDRRRADRSTPPDVSEWEVDRCWNPVTLPAIDDQYDPSWWCAEETTVARYQLVNVVDSILDQRSPFRSLQSPAYLDDVRHGEGPVEDRLATYLAQLDSLAEMPAVHKRIDDAISSTREIDVLNRITEQVRSPELARNVLLFAPFWLRSPLSWDGTRPVAEHLFAAYPVPSCLREAWTRNYGLWFEGDASRLYKWPAWFIIFGQGGSLRRASTSLRWQVPRKFAHFLQAAPPDLTPEQAVVYASILCAGGTAVDYTRVIANDALVLDPTDSAAHTERWINFWHTTVRWIVTHGPELDDAQADRILAWAVHLHTEEYSTLTGCRVTTALTQSRAWRQSIRDNRWWFADSWASHDMDWTVTEGGFVWTFVELTTSSALYDEGRRQDHCVASYTGLCATGATSIVSMRRNGESTLTIEVDPATKGIRQARGHANRPPTSDERVVLQLWATAVLGLQRT